jgi:hypothetical protein
MIRSASYPSLEDRVAVVTGGGSGIGASIVEHLCAQRVRVAFVDIERAASEAVRLVGFLCPRFRRTFPVPLRSLTRRSGVGGARIVPNALLPSAGATQQQRDARAPAVPVGSEYSAEPHSVRAGLRHGTIGP